MVIAGESETVRKEREAVLNAIDSSEHCQYVILFKGATSRFDFRALYAAIQTSSEEEPALHMLYGTPSKLAPQILEPSQVERFFKYSSAQRNFNELVG